MRASFFLVLLCSVLSAQAATKKPAASPSPEKPWAIEWSNKYQFSLHSADDANKRSSINSILAVKYKVNPSVLLQGALGGVQAIKPSLDFRVVNPEFRGFFVLNDPEEKVKFSIGPTLILPFGTDAKEESLLFGAGVGARASVNLRGEDRAGFKGYYDLTFNKNFHQYDTSVFAQVNNQFSLNHAFYGDYAFDEQWSVNATLAFSSLWNYFGLLTNNYTVEQEVDFAASDLLTIFLSHSRGGDFLSPNGRNYSFGIFNGDSSRISIGAVLTF